MTALDVILEDLKGKKNEKKQNAEDVAALFKYSGSLGSDILRELKGPLLAIFSLGLGADFLGRAVPQAKMRLKKTAGKSER